MTRLHLPPPRRDLIAAVSLLVLVLIAFPLLGSLLGNWFAPPPPTRQAAVSTLAPPTSSPTSSATPSETSTPAVRASTDAAPSTTSPSLASISPSSTALPSSTTTATATPTFTRTPTAVTTPLPSVSPSATPLARVYLIPFRQVFAIGIPQPVTSTPILLYENGSDVFLVLERQGPYARLQTLDGRLNFWTGIENISAGLPPPPQYDFSVRGKTARLANATGVACLHEGNAIPVFSVCQPLANLSTATLTARILSGSSLVYLADVSGKSYYLVPITGMSIS